MPVMLPPPCAKAVRSRLHLLISGGASSGKTTFLNALIREISPDERLILIEDTPEIRLQHFQRRWSRLRLAAP